MVIGISGKIGSGKTTLADYLVRRSGGVIRKMSFATLLKQVSAMILGCDPARLSDTEFKNRYMEDWKMTVGEFLQWFGTDVCRNRNPNVWVNGLMRLTEGLDVVVDDVRFMNEAMAVFDSGGIMIRLDGDPRKVRKNSGRDLNHISETELDNFAGFRLRLDTNKLSKTEVGNKVYEFVESKFSRKFTVIGDKQHQFKIPVENFDKMFSGIISQHVTRPEDLNKTVIELIMDRINYLEKTDPNVMYKLRTGTEKDIRPEVVAGKISKLIIDLVDGNKN